jgi:HAD superfamily hydrolase (TIGR01509 family)
MVINTIIFDCFGVLATDGWLPFKERNFSHDKALFAQATDLSKQADSGFINYDDYVHEIAVLAHVTEQEVRSRLDDNVPNEPLFTYIQEMLKPHYKLGILSNAGADWLQTIFTQEQIKLFDATVLSYQVGMVKPNPRMYEVIAERLNVSPTNCVFIDDQQGYCRAATDVGMKVVWYQNVAQMKTDLKKILAK